VTGKEKKTPTLKSIGGAFAIQMSDPTLAINRHATLSILSSAAGNTA
jgi:hypothetical protein